MMSKKMSNSQTLVLVVIIFIAGFLLAKELPSTFKAAIIPRVANTRFQPSRKTLSHPRRESFLRMNHDIARAKQMHARFNFTGARDPR